MSDFRTPNLGLDLVPRCLAVIGVWDGDSGGGGGGGA